MTGFSLEALEHCSYCNIAVTVQPYQQRKGKIKVTVWDSRGLLAKCSSVDLNALTRASNGLWPLATWKWKPWPRWLRKRFWENAMTISELSEYSSVACMPYESSHFQAECSTCTSREKMLMTKLTTWGQQHTKNNITLTTGNNKVRAKWITNDNVKAN